MQENGFPSGSGDLEADMALLEAIQIAGQKK